MTGDQSNECVKLGKCLTNIAFRINGLYAMGKVVLKEKERVITLIVFIKIKFLSI